MVSCVTNEPVDCHPPKSQLNTHKIVEGVLYWTTTQQHLQIATLLTLITLLITHVITKSRLHTNDDYN